MEINTSTSSINSQPVQVAQPRQSYFLALCMTLSVLTLMAIGASCYIYILFDSRYSQLQTDFSELKSTNVAVKAEKDQLAQENDQLKAELSKIKSPENFIGYIPVKFMFNKSQKVGQSFVATESKKISQIELQSSYGIGDDVIVSVYDFPKTSKVTDVDKKKPLTTGTFTANEVIDEQKFIVQFATPVDLIADNQYFIAIEVKNAMTETSVGTLEKNIEPTGNLYAFTRLIGGNGEILSADHSWQPRRTSDLIYKLN